MAGEIASAFVRIRPNMTGFKSETEGGVKSAFSGLGKIIGGALAAASAFEAGKSIITSASAHQTEFALLDKTLKNAGDATKGFGASLEDTLEKEARLKGFSDEDLAASMIRLVSVTKNSAKAFKDLGLAEDLSRATGINLATAALAISKAEEGKATSLQRYGIVLPKVTTAEDALTKSHQDAINAGAKLTSQLNAQYEAEMKVAKAQDLATESQQEIAEIQQRFGGTATTFAQTAQGQFQRLQQDLHQFEVAVGTGLLGGLASAAEGVGSLTNALSTSKGFLDGEKSAIGSVKTALSDLKDAAMVVGPPLITIASAAAKVIQTIGAAPILAVAATYKGIAIATSVAASAQALYAKALGQSTVAEVTEADAAKAALDAVTANTMGLLANTAAVTANVAAVARGDAAWGAYGVELEGVTEAELAAAAAAEALAAAQASAVVPALEQGATGIAAFTKGLGGLGVAAAGGPIVLGLAALAGTIFFLKSREDSAATSTKELASALQTLGSSAKSLPSDKLNVQQGGLDVDSAKKAIEQSKAKAGTAAYAQLVVNLKQAEDSLSQSEQQLTADTAAHRQAVDQATASIEKQNQTITSAAGAGVLSQGSALKDEVQGFRNLAAANASVSPILSRNIGLLADYTASIGHVPKETTVKFFLDNTAAKASVQDILNQEKAFEQQQAQEGKNAGNLFATGFASSLTTTISASLAQAGVDSVVGTIKTAISGALDQVNQDVRAGQAYEKAEKAGAAVIKGIKDGVTTDQSDLSSLKQQIADQVTTSLDSITSAISGAKQSFTSIGSAISTDLQAVLNQPMIDAGNALQAQGDTVALQFDQQGAKIQASAARLSQASAQMQLAQTERTAKFAAENARITQQENALGLNQDQQTLANLRAEVVLPGGKSLSKNADEALAQLRRFAVSAKGVSKQSVEEFIDQLQGAQLSVEKDKIGIATAQSPASAAKQATNDVASAKNAYAQQVLDAKKSLSDTRAQIQHDVLAIEQDLADAKSRIAAKEIADITDAFDQAPSATKLKQVTGKIASILSKDGVTFGRAGKELGSSFLHGLEGQLTGLSQQGSALLGTPSQPGGGQIPSITKPLETITQQNEQSASLTRQYRSKALDLQKKQTDLTTKIHALLATADYAASLARNPGKASKRAKALTGSGG